jgi:hypothetical protein
LPIGQFPLLRSLAPVLATYDGAAELERGLDILLAGLSTTLTPRRSNSPAAGEAAQTARRPRARGRDAGRTVTRPAGSCIGWLSGPGSVR